MKFDICLLELDGWYFGKTGGVLGNMNNEVYDDASLLGIVDETKWESKWALHACQENEHSSKTNVSLEVLNTCDAFFKSKISEFIKCFAIVDPSPYYTMCLDLGADSFLNAINDVDIINKGVCTAALAYMESCSSQNVALRVPVTCIHCNLINGSYVPEGTLISFNETDAQNTADIVFIIEAKPCNKVIVKTKSMISVVTALEKELNDINITNNRYSVIAYGGLPPFDEPRAIVYNNQIFSSQLKYYFDQNWIKPLAIESRGSIFTARKLKPLNKSAIIAKKFSIVFGKRVAKTAVASTCQTCECSGHDTGMAYMSCTSCNNPNLLMMDYGFDEDEMYAFMQEGSDFDFKDSDVEFD